MVKLRACSCKAAFLGVPLPLLSASTFESMPALLSQLP